MRYSLTLQPASAAGFSGWGVSEVRAQRGASACAVDERGTWVSEMEELPAGILTQERNWDPGHRLQGLPSCLL